MVSNPGCRHRMKFAKMFIFGDTYVAEDTEYLIKMSEFILVIKILRADLWH